MKKIVYLISIFLLHSVLCDAQIITVTLKTGQIQIPKQPDSFKYKTPFYLYFDEATFKGKKIAFYSSKNDSNIIVDAKFGDSISHTTIDGKNVYEVQINKNTIYVKDNKIVPGDSFYCRIDDGAYSQKIKFEKESSLPPPPPVTTPTNYHIGSIINDAFFLNSLRNGTNPKDSTTIKTILRAYGINDNTVLADNKFLESEIKVIFGSTKKVADKKDGGIQPDALSSAISSIGGLDVTNIADGFAKFIVKRTKEELSIAFFQKFKDDLIYYPDLKTAFPSTYNLLLSIDQQIYNYSNYINNLREAFRSDLQAIDEHLPSIIDNHPDFFDKKNNFEFGLALRTGCYVSTSLKHDMHPGDILDGYPISFFDTPPVEDKAKLDILKGSIQALQLFSESLKESDTTKHTYWVGADKIRQLVNDKNALKIYIGLLLQVAHQKYDDVKFDDTSSFYKKMNKMTVVDGFNTDYNAYRQYILTLGNKVTELNKMVKDYEKPTSDSIKVEQYAKYFKTSVQFIEYCVQVSTLPHIREVNGLTDLTKNTKTYFDIAYETTDLATAINRKRYPEAINDLIVIYNTIYVQPSVDVASVSANSITLTKKQRLALADKLISENAKDPSKTTKDVIGQVHDISGLIKDKDPNAKDAGTVLASFAKYGAFMSNMINAQSSDDVEKAVEAVALPTGSAKIKRESKFNVSINAYCGLFAGNEVIKGVDPDKPFSKFNSNGITAPIGFAFSWGDRILPWWKLKGCSSSIFISLVDIGAVAAFRFTNDTTAQVTSIQLKDIFSPGLFWSIGIPKSPISLNFGAQMGPNLRNVKSTTNDYSNNMYIRYSFSVCVDLPLLNLYTKSAN